MRRHRGEAGGFVPQETPPAPEPAREPILTRINRACAEYMRSALRPPGAVLLGSRAYTEAVTEARKHTRNHDMWPPPAGLLRYMSPVGPLVLCMDNRCQPDDVWACPSIDVKPGRVQ